MVFVICSFLSPACFYLKKRKKGEEEKKKKALKNLCYLYYFYKWMYILKAKNIYKIENADLSLRALMLDIEWNLTYEYSLKTEFANSILLRFTFRPLK